jgi:hypothetical protein
MSPLPTRTLLRVHRYLGLVAAPLVLFFSVSGIWQVYRLQDTKKDGSYVAPRSLAEASKLHKVEKVRPGAAASGFRIAVSAAAATIAISTTLGLVVALRITRPRSLAMLLLAAGFAVPLALYLLAR